MRGQITLPNVGTKQFFDFLKGWKQCGVETPDQWRALLDHILEPVVRTWCRSGFGFKLVDENEEDEYLINHAIWADNIVLFATSYDVVQQMILDLDEAMGSFVLGSGERYFK